MKHHLYWVLTLILLGACGTGEAPPDSQSRKGTGNQAQPPPASAPALEENAKRVALIVGNADYQHIPSLDNPVNDANDMTTVLQKLGFEILLGRNASQRDLENALHTFGQRLEDGGVGLFYFSGHGLQVEQSNFLVPVDANIRTEADIKFESVNAGRALAQMEQRNPNGLNIVILDACRDNPFDGTAMKGLRKGLAKMNSPRGTLIAYATSPNLASYGDSDQRNSIYTKYLLNGLRDKSHLSVLDMLTTVASQVVAETNGLQVPWKADSLVHRFCFADCGSGQPPARPDMSRLLHACQTHFQANRLTSGRGGNALACYEEVLATDSANADALAGIEKIEARYVQWAKAALQQRQLDQAKRHLASLRQMNPNSAELIALEAQLVQPMAPPARPDMSALLRVCETHFQANRLTSGRGGTALACYEEVLATDSANADALAGIEKIEARYVQWAKAALQQRKTDKAKRYLASLRQMNPNSSQLAALEAQLVSDNNPFVAGQAFRDRLTDGSDGPEMVWIPAGRFRMGDLQGGGGSDEKPVHSVSVDRFALGKYELTVGEFRRFVNATGYQTDAEKGDGCYVDKDKKSSWSYVKDANWRNPYFSQTGNHPVVCISWNDATAYVKWLSRQTGHQYILPTEAQWEYAARAGTETSRYWGNDPNDACRYANVADKTAKQKYSGWSIHNCTDGYVYTAPVGRFKPNVFGLFDMIGNTWEWTCSEYTDKYTGKEQQCVESAGLFVVRSGSWLNGARRARSAYRFRYEPTERLGSYGVRPARIR